MTDPAEAIRAEYVEVIAMQQMGVNPARWHAASEALRTATRALAEPIVAALEAAGMLPTAAWWGVADANEIAEGLTPDMRWSGDRAEELARRAAKQPGDILIRRYVTGWQEVERD